MKQMRREDIEKLVNPSRLPCVTVYMPVEQSWAATQRNALQYKFLLSEASARLKEWGVGVDEIKKMLKPALYLLLNGLFSRELAPGLALFIRRDQFLHHFLPFAAGPLTMVAADHHIQPLLSLFDSEQTYYILVLNPGKSKLLDCSRFACAETALDEKRSSERQSANEAYRAFCRSVDEALAGAVRDTSRPVLPAGAAPVVETFRRFSQYPVIAEHDIVGDPSVMPNDELHLRSLSLMQSHFKKLERDEAIRFRKLENERRASDDIERIIGAGYEGRIETVFLGAGITRWGCCDPNRGSVVIHTAARPGDSPLLDVAALHTLMHKGRAFVVTPAEVPGSRGEGAAAAIFRKAA